MYAVGFSAFAGGALLFAGYTVAGRMLFFVCCFVDFVCGMCYAVGRNDRGGNDVARTLHFEIPEHYNGRKVIHFLRGEAGLSSRLTISLKYRADGILLNGEHIRTIDLLKTGDVLTVNLPDETSTVPAVSVVPLDIVYEDEDILVINKPAGLAMHPTHNHQDDSLANCVASYRPGTVFRAVGRLDKCTSGLVLCAMNQMAAAALSGKYEKEYLALAGAVFEGSGTIDKPIYRPDPMKTLRAVGETGESAVTHWQALATDGRNTLLRIRLETGRTHQIRVHFASLGAPLLGDEMYGSDITPPERAALHCEKLTFVHPVTKQELCFSAPMPQDMQTIADQMKYYK